MKIAIAVAVGVLAFAASQGFGQVTSSSGREYQPKGAVISNGQFHRAGLFRAGHNPGALFGRSGLRTDADIKRRAPLHSPARWPRHPRRRESMEDVADK